MQSPPILELMSRQIASERDTKLAAAKSSADRIKADARTRADARRRDLLAAVEQELSELKRRSHERAEAETEMIVLTTKDTVTDELLGRARAELNRVAASPDFSGVLDALLAELVQDAPADGIVLVPVAHEAHCRAWLQENGHGDKEVLPQRDLIDGVAVQDKAHTFRITNTLSTRFQQLEPSLRKLCVAELFGQGA